MSERLRNLREPWLLSIGGLTLLLTLLMPLVLVDGRPLYFKDLVQNAPWQGSVLLSLGCLMSLVLVFSCQEAKKNSLVAIGMLAQINQDNLRSLVELIESETCQRKIFVITS